MAVFAMPFVFIFATMRDAFCLREQVSEGQKSSANEQVLEHESMRANAIQIDFADISYITSEERRVARLERELSAFKTSNLVMFQSDDRPPKVCGEHIRASLDDLVYTTAILNLDYASKHGYDFIRFTARIQGRHPAWLKLWGASILLKHYQYVLYLDSDAIVHTRDSLENALGYVASLRYRTIMMDSPHHGITPNTGVWMIRNSSVATNLLSEVWAYPVHHIGQFYNRRISFNDTLQLWPWEVAGFFGVYKSLASSELESILQRTPRFTMDHPDGKVIRHLWSVGSRDAESRWRPPKYAEYIQSRLKALSVKQIEELVCRAARLWLGGDDPLHITEMPQHV